uniref:Uncharacterized protein n=1 Tax=Triticum urartu TaxID=4572 RepID=A0A8R7UHA8_TRIUA
MLLLLLHEDPLQFCIRCGRRSFHLQKSTYSLCGYLAARIRKCEVRIHVLSCEAYQQR